MGIIDKLLGRQARSNKNGKTAEDSAFAQNGSQGQTGKDTVMTTQNSTQIAKALDLIGTFASGDAEKAASLLAEGYLQHNLAHGTGRDAFVGSVQYLAGAPAPTTVRNIRAFEDGDAYLQHNTGIADGLSGLGAALEALGKQGIQMIYDRTHLVLAQGDMVLGVSEGTFGGAPTAYYDLWRVENGKIAERWDVMAEIPERSTWQNDNGKF